AVHRAGVGIVRVACVQLGITTERGALLDQAVELGQLGVVQIQCIGLSNAGSTGCASSTTANRAAAPGRTRATVARVVGCWVSTTYPAADHRSGRNGGRSPFKCLDPTVQ